MEENSEEEASFRLRLPRKNENEVFGIAIQLMGANQIKVKCADGVVRGCRIPGKLRKKVWVRTNDLVIVKIWDFQPIKGDIAWRYLPNQTDYLKRKGYLQGVNL